MVFVFSLLRLELFPQLYLRLRLEHEFLVTTDYFVFDFIQVLAYHSKVVRNCVVVCLMVSVRFLEWICIELNFLLHLHGMSALHQVYERGVHIAVFSHRVSQVKLLRVSLVSHKNVKERIVKMAVIQKVIHYYWLNNLWFLFSHLNCLLSRRLTTRF